MISTPTLEVDLESLKKLKKRMQEEEIEQVQEVEPEGPYTIIDPFETKFDVEYQELETEMA